MSSISKCPEFRAHHLRPDKCRNCFGDASSHVMTNSDEQQQQQQQASTTTAKNANSINQTATETTTTRDHHQPTTKQETDDTSGDLNTSKQCQACQKLRAELDEARLELGQWRGRCLEAERDNERAHEELRCLEKEMEEMHDNFKEEESEQFEQVKQELDAAIKNCKILQIRLNKSERQYHQLEQIKTMLERQLEETRQEQNNQQQQQQQSTTTTSQDHEQAAFKSAGQFAQLGPDYVKLATQEYDQLLRDLNDTIEREKDLQEQIKYSQEEIQLKGDRLQAIELENEILLSKINKLTLINSRLRSSTNTTTTATNRSPSLDEANDDNNNNNSDGRTVIRGSDTPSSNTTTTSNDEVKLAELRDLLEQSEQLKLALEVAQSENKRFKNKVQELTGALEARDKQLAQLEAQLDELKRLHQDESSSSSSTVATKTPGGSPQVGPATSAKLELECRQLRSRLVQSERERRQLKAQLDLFGAPASGAPRPRAHQQLGLAPRSQSVESAATAHQHLRSQTDPDAECRSSRCQASLRQLQEQCNSLQARNADLERRLQRYSMELRLGEGGVASLEPNDAHSPASLESDLLEKLKKQLDKSESELAKARSRLVELDLECGRAQRQYKRLLASLESCGGGSGDINSGTTTTTTRRASRLPADESKREAMSRQELRQAISDLEGDLEEMLAVIRAKDVLIKELQAIQLKLAAAESKPKSDPSGGDKSQQQHDNAEEQVKSLRRLIDQERLLSNNLKLDVANLEQAKNELDRQRRMLERERVAMDEELDKLRQVNGELRCELDESDQCKLQAQARARELAESLDKLRLELKQHKREQSTTSGNGQAAAGAASNQEGPSDLLLMARDLSELRVKNGFLMRQLEMARDETARQLDELRESHEVKLKRAIELAQLELRERHLVETQQLRDELAELKQRLASVQRQCQRHEEETSQERGRLRSMERDWRRDKSQWQQQREQLEGQLAIERRSSEFKFKESESALRDKERALLGLQDRCVQLERDLKRLQNKHQILEEDSESRLRGLAKELESKTKEHSELLIRWRHMEGQFYDSNRRLQEEKTTLSETLTRLRQSYDEKLLEFKRFKEFYKLRQEQSLRETKAGQERAESLIKRCNELAEQETQNKLLKQRLELVERQLESHRRDLVQLREERVRLKTRCDELEKRELITKTNTISYSASNSFLKPFIGQPSSSSGATGAKSLAGSKPLDSKQDTGANVGGQTTTTVERLSGKINDQRHLIEMLRQQLNENQLELKQLKLIQTSERFKWQARVNILQSRLNELEEKLAFETSLYEANPELLDQLARPRMDQNWGYERQANLDLIQQQQAQIELLSRDLKKVSQAHDLLRLHSKQLESYNNKLSKKLIEYQQQRQPTSSRQDGDTMDSPRSSRLTQELAPLVAIVNKIVASLDAPDQQQQVQAPPPQPQSKSLSSTNRPLRAPQSRGASQDSDASPTPEQQQQQLPSPSSISTSPPAHQLAADRGHHQSRLTRLFGGGRPAAASASSSRLGSAERPTTASPNDIDDCCGGGDETSTGRAAQGKRAVKRVRIKCSSLGITTAEKKQLKLHLEALASELNLASTRQQQQPALGGTTQSSARASPDGQASIVASSVSNTTPAATTTTTTTNRGVRWQVDSDLDSERSWSAEPQQQQFSNNNNNKSSNSYRRFPQATPSSSGRHHHHQASGGGGEPRGASLTDYESESSLASDFSISSSAGGLWTRKAGGGGGAESDSGLTSATSLSGRRRAGQRGLKSRLTSTLRSLSRSITAGLGSDSETGELPAGARSKSGRKQTAESPSASSAVESSPPKRGSELREIRV